MSDFIRNLFSEDFRDIEERLRLAENNLRLAENKARLAKEAHREDKSTTVRNLLDMDIPHDKIAEATGLQLSVVEELADES